MSVAEKLAGNPVVAGVLLLGAAGAALYWFFGDRLRSVVTKDLNPLSNDNLAYRAASSVLGSVVSADSGYTDSVGGWLYDVTHADAPASVFYLVGFPDGSRHAVASSDVTGNRFTRDGTLFELRSDSAGRFAVPIGVKQSGGATRYW